MSAGCRPPCAQEAGAASGLARRLGHAARGAGGARSQRGRPQTAPAIRGENVARTDEHRTSLEVAILTGRADRAAHQQAEKVFRGRAAGELETGFHSLLEPARLALVRCLFWRGRYGEAAKMLASIDGSTGESHRSVTLAVAQSRLAVGERDLGPAVAKATQALEAAERLGAPSLVASAACGAAFAHLAVGDCPSVERDAALSIRAARAARDRRGAARRCRRREPRQRAARRVGTAPQPRQENVTAIAAAADGAGPLRAPGRSLVAKATARGRAASSGHSSKRWRCCARQRRRAPAERCNAVTDDGSRYSDRQTAEEDEAILAQVCAA